MARDTYFDNREKEPSDEEDLFVTGGEDEFPRNDSEY